ncbi:MAG: tetratricopeptide repeat protein [Bdellovibrionales bacterium]|nr:tetratricopeptide repeat protein [Bdellovibrionales bacterium]
MMTRLYKILPILLVTSSLAHAVKMDETTHDMIIQRLELGIDTMGKNEPERNGILLRLADLYADRARLKAINEMDSNCTSCKGARNDRKRAIALLNEALPKAPADRQGPAVLQIAHLNGLNDESTKATQLYKGVLKNKSKYSSEVLAIANANVAEIYFKKGDFKTALSYYEAARRENLKTRALVEYRIAWCHLNMGKNEQAIKTMTGLLRNPEMLATQTTDGKTVDPTFVADASRDLARFLARTTITPSQIELLRGLSPDGARKTNLHTLGTEADRLGKKQESLIVWAAYVDEGDVQANEKLEIQIRVARIFYDLNKQDLAINAFEKALDLWSKNGCKNNEELCKELKSRVRAMVLAWNKAQKEEPTTHLFRAYVAYTNVFQDDVEMLHWGAVVGHDLKKHKESITLFRRASTLAAAQLAKNANDKNLKKIFEGSLLGEIEMAEASKDAKAQEAAYNFYLQMNPNGEQAFQVRYQRAQTYYSSNRFQEAFSEFHYLASQPGKNDRDLKVKSADLALDSLAALKDDKNIQVRSLEYARLFPERKTEYLKISRKASMNLVAANLKNGKETDRSDYRSSLAALDKVNMEGADDAEKIKFYKNKLTVAQKALALDSVNDTCNRLLLVKSLSKEDHEWVLEQKVWVAELQLNFSLAYEITQAMKLPNLSKAERELRLALLAELSGQSSRQHNEAFLRHNKNARAGNLVRITLIKDSSNPWRELDKHLSSLKQTPDLLAGITLETFARDKNFTKAERLLRTTRIGQYPAGLTLARHLEMRDFHAFDRKIRSHRVQGFSDVVMQKTLKERLKLLNQSEKQAQAAIGKRDWTLQVLTLSQLARENRRLYKDILSLPVPRRLSAEDKQKYLQILKAQSEPYLARAEKIESELNAMWGNSNSVQNLQATYMTSTPELQKFYRDEIKELAAIAPSRAGNRLNNLLNTPFRRPSQKDILTARRDLQKDPFDISKAQSLRELEAQNGKAAMVVYLDARISQLKKGKDL